MLRNAVLPLLILPSLAVAQDATEGAESARAPSEQPAPEAAAEETGGVKTLAGISILGNEEAPKSLVIVPWKSSQIGDGLGVHDAMDDRPRPVDKEVFMREVHYFELRSGARD